MPIFGAGEVEYWQLTPMGVQRLQTGQLRGIGPAEKTVLYDIAELGGIAERDELTVGGNVSPMVLNTTLRRLADLGWIQPVTAPSTEA